MATKKEPAMDMSNVLGDLTKMLEQFKLPGVDTKEILEARRKDIDALLAADRGFWARPEMRFYVTHARWNEAANAAAAGGLTGFGDGKTSGTSYGVQAEVWW